MQGWKQIFKDLSVKHSCQNCCELKTVSQKPVNILKVTDDNDINDFSPYSMLIMTLWGRRGASCIVLNGMCIACLENKKELAKCKIQVLLEKLS